MSNQVNDALDLLSGEQTWEAPANIEQTNITGESTVDDYEKRVAAYVADCKIRIKKNWVVKPTNVYLRIETRFRIQIDGSITDEMLTVSCGSEYFDELVLKALKASSPLPKLPTGAPDFFDVNFAFELSPRRQLEETKKTQVFAPPRRKPVPVSFPIIPS